MKLTRDFYIPEGAKEIKAATTDAVAYTNDYPDGTKYTVMVFGGKRTKYDKYYGFKTKEDRENYILKYFAQQENLADSKKKWAEKQKAQAEENQKSYRLAIFLFQCGVMTKPTSTSTRLLREQRKWPRFKKLLVSIWSMTALVKIRLCQPKINLLASQSKERWVLTEST